MHLDGLSKTFTLGTRCKIVLNNLDSDGYFRRGTSLRFLRCSERLCYQVAVVRHVNAHRYCSINEASIDIVGIRNNESIWPNWSFKGRQIGRIFLLAFSVEILTIFSMPTGKDPQ